MLAAGAIVAALYRKLPKFRILLEAAQAESKLWLDSLLLNNFNDLDWTLSKMDRPFTLSPHCTKNTVSHSMQDPRAPDFSKYSEKSKSGNSE